jgi:hypothetical protein
LILISDGEDHSEEPRQQQRKPISRNEIITIGLGTEKGLFL